MVWDSEELKKSMKEQPEVYADIARKKVDDDLDSKPIVILDDPNTGKTLIASLKDHADKGRMRSYSKSSLVSNPRIEMFSPHQYFVIVGDHADALFPVFSGDRLEASPMWTIEHAVYWHMLQHRGRVPSGKRLADMMAKYFSNKIPDTYMGGLRPRGIEAVLVSNPSEDRILPKDKGEDTRIYAMERSSNGDTLVVRGIGGKGAFYASSQSIWSVYEDALKKIGKGKRKKRLNLDDRMVAATKAVLSSNMVLQQHHSMVDIVTVPFEPPKGNKSKARYDPDFVEKIYDRAMALR